MQRKIDAAAKQTKAVTARFNIALEVRCVTLAAEVRSASSSPISPCSVMPMRWLVQAALGIWDIVQAGAA